MSTLESSFNVLEIPNDAVQHSAKIWLAVQHSVKSNESWLVNVEKNEKATLNISMSYFILFIKLGKLFCGGVLLVSPIKQPNSGNQYRPYDKLLGCSK